VRAEAVIKLVPCLLLLQPSSDPVDSIAICFELPYYTDYVAYFPWITIAEASDIAAALAFTARGQDVQIAAKFAGIKQVSIHCFPFTWPNWAATLGFEPAEGLADLAHLVSKTSIVESDLGFHAVVIAPATFGDTRVGQWDCLGAILQEELIIVVWLSSNNRFVAEGSWHVNSGWFLESITAIVDQFTDLRTLSHQSASDFHLLPFIDSIASHLYVFTPFAFIDWLLVFSIVQTLKWFHFLN